MSFFWINWSLLYVFLHRVSADEGNILDSVHRIYSRRNKMFTLSCFLFSGVKLICNEMVKVQFGHSVMLNCTINWTQHGQNCKGEDFHWRHTDTDTHDSISCTHDSYTCEWDKITYVSLTILNVSKNENYTVGMFSNCGMDTSPSITVQIDGKWLLAS